jgi:glycosyltransferase involved in cell wall biosynthesis
VTSLPRVVFLSAVGGGPISRVVEAISRRGGVRIRTVNCYSTIEWRRHRSASRVRSLLARVAVFFFYPLYALTRARGTDVVIASTNPFWLPNLLLASRRLHGAAVITLVYDLYPDSLMNARPLPQLIYRAMHRLNRHWASQSDAVVFIAPSMRSIVETRYGAPRRSEVLVTGTDVQEFTDPPPQPDLERWVGDRMLISYIGNAGYVHDVDTFSDVASRLSERYPDEIAFFVSASGGRARRLVDAISHLPQARVEPPLDEARWRWVQGRTDMAVITLSSEAAHASMPSKYYSALGAGCAIVAIAPMDSDVYQQTLGRQLGVAAVPGAVKTVMRSVSDLVENRDKLRCLRERAAHTAKTDFDIHVIADNWESLISSLALTRPTGRLPGSLVLPAGGSGREHRK